MQIFQEFESEVRSYIRSFPTIFSTAKGAYVYDENGKEYIDFFAGAGTLNYGHNNPKITEAMIEYLQEDGIVHALDKGTVAKKAFIQKIHQTILAPRNLNYKIQFTGPTGTNAMEAALKLARMVKKRSNIISFTNGYHGLTMGSLAVTGNAFYRDESFGARQNAQFMPFDGYFGPETNTIDYLRRFLEDNSSGVDIPAAIVVETVQGEGGINVASEEWLRQLQNVCREYEILLIVDDIQVGNGRTGTFFSFERAGIRPDMVAVSKSIGGGLPMALLLIDPEIDQWEPGKHTGTFRGNNLAFVAATKAIEYWDDDRLAKDIKRKGRILESELNRMHHKFRQMIADVRGVGMVWGMEMPTGGVAKTISRKAFEKGLLVEVCGPNNEVIKFLPPLVIDEDTLRSGLKILETAISETMAEILDPKEALLVGAAK
jgi:diaminobutyrate-2-oxoglutarate transaminase